MTHLKRSLLLILVFALVSCNFPGLVGAPMSAGSTAEKGISLLYNPSPDATATPTPFQPLPPTPTYLPTLAELAQVTPLPTLGPPSWGDYPPPSAPSPLPIPPPVPRFPKPDGQVNILLFGSDQRRGTGGFRTDTILLLTLNTVEQTASLTSFPRDLFVYIPGWTMERINTAHPRGEFTTSAMTFEYNFGVRPDYYIMINFWSFVEVIDSLGGIDVYVPSPLKDVRSGYGEYSVPAGIVRMDGETALWYVRSRYTSSDFERTRRQQEVIKAIATRLFSLNAVARAPDLFRTYQQSVTTNLEFSDIAPLLPMAARMNDPSRLKQYYIGRAQVTNWRTPAGAQVLLPNREAVLEVLHQALSVP